MTDGDGNRPVAAPAPVLTPLTEGMWRAAAGGELHVQQCDDCEARRCPPSDGCPRCGSLAWSWTAVPGTGAVVTFSWVPQPDGAGLYNLAIVDLDGAHLLPLRIASNVLDAWEPGDLRVGDRVELACVTVEPGIGLPCFRRSA